MATKSNSTGGTKSKPDPIFNGLNIFIINKGIGSIQLRIIQEQIQKREGKVAAKLDNNVDVIISPLDHFKTMETLGATKPRARIHKLAWITESLSRGKRAGDNEFLVEAFNTDQPTKSGALQRTQSDLGATRSFLKRKLEDTSGHIFTPPAKRAKTTDHKFELNIKKGGLALSYELDEADNEELPQEKITKPSESASANRTKLTLLQSASQPILSFEKKDSQSSSEYECEDHLKKSQELSPQGKKKPDNNPFLALLKQASQPINTSGFEDLDQSQESSSAGSTPATSPTGKFNSPPNNTYNSNISSRNPFLRRNSTSPESPPKRAMRMIKGNSFAKLLFDEERDSGEEYDTDEEEMILELKEEKKRGKLAKKGNSGTKLERSSSDLAKLSELEEYVLTDSQSVFADENSNDPTTPSYSKFLYNITPEEKEKRERRRQYFGCQKSPQQLPLQAETNVNKKLTDQLQILEQNCQTKGDKWRSYAYRKAIAVLKSTKFEIKTAEQAKKLRGIGAKIADKIGEILSTGTLRRIKSEAEDEMTKTLVMFSKVFGAGPETAKKWHAKGYRTIDDLKKSDKLTQQQKIGVKYYEEFQKRIPREEVDTLSGMVYKHALEIDSEFVMEVCGSYRRGKKDCGDIDVLLTHKTNRPIDGAMERLIDALTEIGFLTDHLTDPHKSKENDKYMGVCQWNDLPHRRIDIKIVPKEEWWFALLYFTGSDHFNRSMRLWARRHGYQLTEKHIVKRYAEEVLGEPIPVNSEQDVFAVLGLEYRPPNEREV